jgi:hypothetical protein
MRTTRLPTRAVMAFPLAATLALTACAGSGASEPATDTASPSETTLDTVEDVDTTTSADDSAEDNTARDSTVDSAASASGYVDSYALADDEFGTMTTVTVEGDTRTIVSNALPDHETGEFPNAGNPNSISEQATSYEYSTDPVYIGEATTARTPGVAVNGVKFEPATAETVECASGEILRVEALQDIYNLGLDLNNAHVQPTGEYHYHGISKLLADAYSSEDDLVHVGFAADGFLMYYSKSGAYDSGYALSNDPRTGTDCVGSMALGNVDVDVEGTTPDGTYASDWVHSDETGDLDECSGVEIDGEYAYLITDTYPYVSRCLNGEFTETGPGAGGPPPGGETGGPPPGDQGAPDTEG